MPHHPISHPIILKNTQLVKNLKGQAQKKAFLDAKKVQENVKL